MSILEIKNLKVDYETEENTVHALINVSLQMTGGEGSAPERFSMVERTC